MRGAGALQRKRCFEPVVDERTRLIVLGSLPGEKSLERQQYYGHRQNQFWKLMSKVVDHDLVPLDYGSRLKILLAHEVGLWDVIAEANRHGSLDGNIRNREHNDLNDLLRRYPSVKAIAFNGKTAHRVGLKILGGDATRYRIVELPSSSPAYTLAEAEKARRWRVLRKHLGH